MNMKRIACAALAATLGFGTAAQARDWSADHSQRQETRRYERQYERQQRHYQQGPQSYQRNGSQPQYRAYSQVQPAPQYRTYDRYAPQYGYAPQYRSHSYAYSPRYYTGGYVPHQYRAQRYWVNDWRSRHLYAPPYGYQWVETDTGDVLLMALATGLIASVILSQ
jgi:Ni/Co efflux regulator RcnB